MPPRIERKAITPKRGTINLVMSSIIGQKYQAVGIPMPYVRIACVSRLVPGGTHLRSDPAISDGHDRVTQTGET